MESWQRNHLPQYHSHKKYHFRHSLCFTYVRFEKVYLLFNFHLSLSSNFITKNLAADRSSSVVSIESSNFTRPHDCSARAMLSRRASSSFVNVDVCPFKVNISLK